MRAHRRIALITMFFAVAALSLGGAGAAVNAAVEPESVSRVTLTAPAAAGGQAARFATAPMKLKILAQCSPEAAVFRVVNDGEVWPKAGHFKIYRINGNAEISDRRMRLAPGQQASFKVKKKLASGDEMGLRVEPGWYSRKFSYDARVRCP